MPLSLKEMDAYQLVEIYFAIFLERINGLQCSTLTTIKGRHREVTNHIKQHLPCEVSRRQVAHRIITASQGSRVKGDEIAVERWLLCIVPEGSLYTYPAITAWILHHVAGQIESVSRIHIVL